MAERADTRSGGSSPAGPARRRFRMVSKAQVSGWRFMLHQLEHALLRRETAVRDDPQKHQSSAFIVGIVVAALVVAGAGIAAFFAPQGSVGNSDIVISKTTGALFVRVGDVLHPVTNLASARLVVGSPENPVQVSEAAIAKMPRGPLVGIAGAPVEMLASSDTFSQWTLCDTAATGAAVPLDPQTGLPTTTAAQVTTTAIGGRLTQTPATAVNAEGAAARLVSYNDQTWLVYRDKDGAAVRSQVDMSDTAVTTAFGLDTATTVTPVSTGLFNALQQRAPLQGPQIADAGKQSRLPLGTSGVKVGSVLRSSTVGSETFYVVLADGVQQVSKATAALIRSEDSQGAVAPIAVTPDALSRIAHVNELPVGSFPATAVSLVAADKTPVTCVTWSKAQSDPTAAVSLLMGRSLPLTTTQQQQVVSLVTASSSQGQTADQVYVPRTSGRFVRVTDNEPTVLTKESLWWISDAGVRYGIDNGNAAAASTNNTVAALGIGDPVPAPWMVVKMFAVGPTLSQADARVTHDGMNVDLNVGALPSQSPNAG